jgi:uncharacterized protein YdeI (YjbR/CyaY-like superfamily)
MRVTDINQYFASGCGRCSLFDTPECKVHTWKPALLQLRQILLDCGLTEVVKWGTPVYMYNNQNIILLGAFKEYCCLGFFKGVLLQDEKKLLTQQGENTQSSKIFKFTENKQVTPITEDIRTYIFEAIEIEKAGLKVPETKKDKTLPTELEEKFNEYPALKTAFLALTPGKQRGYLIHFTGAKQSETRTVRIEKCMPKILAGKGFHD